MQLTVYHLKNCDTCKKAIKALEAAGHTLQLIDVRGDGVPLEKLEAFASSVGHDILLNTRSTTWRGLEQSDKENVDQAKAVKLMNEHPTLIKRPVIESENGVSVGWTKQVQETYL